MMQEILREALGRALQEKRRSLCHDEHGTPRERTWEQRIEMAKEIDRACAEAVIEKYTELLTALDTSLAFEAEMAQIAKESGG